MSQVRCGTCRFWGDDPRDPDENGVYRPCRAVIHDGECYADRRWDDPNRQVTPATTAERQEVRQHVAVVQDGSGYMAVLKCRKDFGCVLWKPTDQPGEAGDANE